MSLVALLKSPFTGDDCTINVDSSLIMESFSYDGFLYVRTPSRYYKKPNYKQLYKKTSKGDFDFNLSAYRTKINQSQAKGLLKYTQLELDL